MVHSGQPTLVCGGGWRLESAAGVTQRGWTAETELGMKKVMKVSKIILER